MPVFSFVPAAPAPARRRSPANDVLGWVVVFEDGTQKVGPNRDYATMSGAPALDQRVRNRLRTKRRSWVGRDTYGGNLEDLVNKPFTPGLQLQIDRDVRDTLSYEPGVKAVLDVEVTSEPAQGGYLLRVAVTYQPIDGDQSTVVLAFKRNG